MLPATMKYKNKSGRNGTFSHELWQISAQMDRQMKG